MTFQTDLKSAEDFKREIIETTGTLQIVELYQPWAGPSKAIVNTFTRIFFDAGNKPLKFYTLDVEAVSEGFEEYKGKCQPVFLLYKDGVVQEKVVGVQAPTLSKHIAAMC